MIKYNDVSMTMISYCHMQDHSFEYQIIKNQVIDLLFNSYPLALYYIDLMYILIIMMIMCRLGFFFLSFKCLHLDHSSVSSLRLLQHDY